MQTHTKYKQSLKRHWGLQFVHLQIFNNDLISHAGIRVPNDHPLCSLNSCEGKEWTGKMSLLCFFSLCFAWVFFNLSCTNACHFRISMLLRQICFFKPSLKNTSCVIISANEWIFFTFIFLFEGLAEPDKREGKLDKHAIKANHLKMN